MACHNAHLEQERRARARERQRLYRLRRRRIDYSPDSSAVATIDSLRTRYVGGDASSVLNRIVRETAVRVIALERYAPTWDALPADVVTQLERLEQRLGSTQAGEHTFLAELLVRVEALEARMRPSGLAACNAQRKARGGALRQAIADILKTAPEATAPLVLECLRSTHAGRLPSARTIRWHLAALRGNGNSNARLPPPGEACSDL